MKIFVAGARVITDLDLSVQKKLEAIMNKGYDILVGDCSGVDACVQKFCDSFGYKNLTVYAGNGHARNNIGNWAVKVVYVPPNLHGFDFYKQKDMAMATDADCGFMIWNGESRGTLNNIINLVSQEKDVLVYMTAVKKMAIIKSFTELSSLIRLFAPGALKTYIKLAKDSMQIAMY